MSALISLVLPSLALHITINSHHVHSMRMHSLYHHKGDYRTVKECSCRVHDYKLCSNGSAFHRDISNAERVKLLSPFKISDVYSAPGHLHVRSPSTVMAIADNIRKSGGLDGVHSSGWTFNKLWVDVGTQVTPDGSVRVCHVELRDGNHRLVGALIAGVWRTLGELGALDVLKVSVNGDWPSDRAHVVPTPDLFWPRFVPIEVGKEVSSQCPAVQYKTSQNEHGMNAVLPKDFTSISQCLNRHRGVPLRSVAHEVERRTRNYRHLRCTCPFGNSACRDGAEFHDDISNARRVSLLSSLELKDLFSEPGASRSIEQDSAVNKITKELKSAQGFSRQTEAWAVQKLWIDVATQREENGSVSVCHVEVRTGLKRLLGAIASNSFETVGDMQPYDVFVVSVNGLWPSDYIERATSNVPRVSRFLPHAVAQEAAENCEHLHFTADGHTARLPKDFTSVNECLTKHKGLPLYKLLPEPVATTEQVVPGMPTTTTFGLGAVDSAARTSSAQEWDDAFEMTTSTPDSAYAPKWSEELIAKGALHVCHVICFTRDGDNVTVLLTLRSSGLLGFPSGHFDDSLSNAEATAHSALLDEFGTNLQISPSDYINTEQVEDRSRMQILFSHLFVKEVSSNTITLMQHGALHAFGRNDVLGTFRIPIPLEFFRSTEAPRLPGILEHDFAGAVRAQLRRAAIRLVQGSPA